jgi:hypothetical protein
VGIVALVDEATGYQAQRAKDELSKILQAYIAEELRPYLPMFPTEFFTQIYRLHNWPLKPMPNQGPRYIGKFINNHIYKQLPPGVLEELRRRNPVIPEKGYRRHKHFQFLTDDTGNPHLDKQISTVTTLMRIAHTKDEFLDLFARAFDRNYQSRLPLDVNNREASPT